MVISPQYIHDKNFSVKMRGYSVDEVNDFLDRVTKDYQSVVQDNQALKKKLASYQTKVDEYDRSKNSLNESIIFAQNTADKLVQEAHQKANNIVQGAIERVREVGGYTNRARDQITVYRNNLKKLIQEQNDVANAPEWEHLLARTNFDDDEVIKELEGGLDQGSNSSNSRTSTNVNSSNTSNSNGAVSSRPMTNTTTSPRNNVTSNSAVTPVANNNNSIPSAPTTPSVTERREAANNNNSYNVNQSNPNTYNPNTYNGTNGTANSQLNNNINDNSVNDGVNAVANSTRSVNGRMPNVGNPQSTMNQTTSDENVYPNDVLHSR